MTLNEDQLAELRLVAESLLTAAAWDSLPWDEAWNGKYPKKPNEQEINKEIAYLVKKVTRILTYGISELDYDNIKEHLRTIHLEFCKTINFYGVNNPL